MKSSRVKPIFFSSPADFRKWLAQNHASAKELWVGYHKKDSGWPSMTWPESVDEALCFGWIDGIRKSVDSTRYKIRFTRAGARGFGARSTSSAFKCCARTIGCNRPA
jgi:uncharacterized protein YdeI (YjbR/CyaY-like superfamily)